MKPRATLLFTGTWVVALAVAWVAACTKSESGLNADEGLSPKEIELRDEYLAEVEVGRDMAGRLLGFYGSVGDEALLGYLNQVGNYVASYSDFPDRRYMFAILETESINAFACPGGYILVTLGTMRNIETEAELAAVLGHEIAHVGKRHMFNTLKQMRKDELDKNAEAGEKAMRDSMAIKMRRRPKQEKTGLGAKVAQYLSNTTGGLNVLTAAKAGMNLIMEKGIAPQLEFEADREGVKYAIRAGYDPRGMLAYLSRVKRSQKKKPRVSKTHPSFGDRISSVKVVLKKLKANEIIGATGTKRLNKVRQDLPEKKEES